MLMSALTKYDAARYALAEAVKIDEVKDIRDKAQAMAAYARQAKDTEMVEWATELKVRAERRAGQMLIEADVSPGPKSQLSKATTINPKLADLGISRDQSANWQKLAAMPEKHFETAVETARSTAGSVTSAFMLREAKKDLPQKAADKAKGKTTPPPKSLYSNPKASPEREITEEEVAAFGDADFVQLYEDSLSEIAVLNKRIDRYELDDKNAEIARLNTYIDRINGLHDATKNELRDALDIGKRNVNTLAKIRKALNVERDQDILSALKKAA